MTEKKPDPARDAVRKALKETDYSLGFFGDGISLALHAARSGDIEHLAKQIEQGATLDPAERKFAADYIRGIARISRRKLDQRIMEYKVCNMVFGYMRQGMNQQQAIREVLNDEHLPEKWRVNSEETIETYLKNYKEGR